MYIFATNLEVHCFCLICECVELLKGMEMKGG